MSQGILHDRQAVLRSRLVGPGHAHTSAAGEAYVVKALDQTHAAKVAMLATRRVKAEHALRLAHPRYVYLGVFKGVSSTPVLVVEIDWDTPTPVVGTVSGRGSAVTLEQHLSAIEAVISAWRTHHRGTGPGGNELAVTGQCVAADGGQAFWTSSHFVPSSSGCWSTCWDASGRCTTPNCAMCRA